MRISLNAGAAALATTAMLALAWTQAEAKPVKMCFKTGNGKSFLTVNPSNGMLLANGRACSGNAIFEVDDFSLRANVPPRIGVPVVIKAANGHYVQFYGRHLRATAPRVRSRDVRFMHSFRPSHDGIKFGAPMASKMRVNLYPMQARYQLVSSAMRGGGGPLYNLRRGNLRSPQSFLTLAVAGEAKPTRPPQAKLQPLPWKGLPGAALDIGVGGGHAWVIGTDKGIYHWNGKTWAKMPGGAARIDVGPRGMAWVVNDKKEIHRFNGATWQKLPGAALDIGVGANGAAWVVGTNGNAYQWTGKTWARKGGAGLVHLDVGPKGLPWAVTKAGDIVRFDGRAWQQVPGKARDVTVGGNGTAWHIGTGKVPGGSGVYRWDGKTWVRHAGGLTMVSADAKGMPWGVNDNRKIFAHAKSAALSPSALMDPKVMALRKKIATTKQALAKMEAELKKLTGQ